MFSCDPVFPSVFLLAPVLAFALFAQSPLRSIAATESTARTTSVRGEHFRNAVASGPLHSPNLIYQMSAGISGSSLGLHNYCELVERRSALSVPYPYFSTPTPKMSPEHSSRSQEGATHIDKQRDIGTR